jgi:hypothetical protein
MPSVEYFQETLIYTEQTKTRTRPETAETVTQVIRNAQRPFELRISKWKSTDDDTYQLYGFVEATDFGQQLASQARPYKWLTTNYQTDNAVTSTVVSEWVQGVSKIINGQLDTILSFGSVSPVSATVDGVSNGRLTFTIELNSATTFDINWLQVDFDPTRGG